jgi:general secretion pathway protein D/MSHA biogenesis protein MshL
MNLGKLIVALSLILTLTSITSCGAKKQNKEQHTPEVTSNQETTIPQPALPPQLPVRYQSPSYITANESADLDIVDETEEYQIKVGATIRSTGGPQPLWDVMKRLANLKGMTVSWASDVDQNSLVDVDISATDDFLEAVSNLLRQADYFHEVQGQTIIVKYKDTKMYKIGIPAMKGGYTSSVGGNFLTQGGEGANNTEGIVKISSDQNQFDVWSNIKLNLDTILEVWSTRREGESIGKKEVEDEVADATRTQASNVSPQGTNVGSLVQNGTNQDNKNITSDKGTGSAKRSSQAYYTIDKSVGLISVTAPKPLLEKVDLYISNLKKELYRQVSLEAKIIEVYLQDNSKIGLDWSSVLKDFNITGSTTFGDSNTGQVYPWTESARSFVNTITLRDVTFDVLLNALNEQGDTHVLANPKLTVLNGQPAVISVGKDISYIKTVSREVDSDTNTTTYSAEVDNVVQGIAMGVMASIVDDKKIILHLTPITTDLVGDDIEYKTFGSSDLTVGLPQIKVREMSTMVEVKNGEMLIIGGLIDSIEENTGSFAPIVGSIPVVKYLFGVEEKISQKRELVILLTPRII